MIFIMTYTNLYMLIDITYLDIGTVRCSEMECLNAISSHPDMLRFKVSYCHTITL